MNWDAIGAAAELLGAIGVILSLVYLAGQIRQNTRAQKRANLGDIAADLAATMRQTSSNPELAGLVLRGFADLGSLDSTERLQFDSYLYGFLAALERALIDGRAGDYPEEQLAPIRIAVAGFLRTGGGRAWWEQRKVWFSAGGQQAMGEILDDQTIEHRDGGPQLPVPEGMERG